MHQLQLAQAKSDLASIISDINAYRAPNVRGSDLLLNFGDDFTCVWLCYCLLVVMLFARVVALVRVYYLL